MSDSSGQSILRLGGTVRNVIETAAERVRARVLPAAPRAGSPRVVLDGVFFQLHRTGIARLWSALMREWSESGFAEHVVVLDRKGTAPRHPGFTYRRTHPFRRFDSSAERAALESICRSERADVFISTYYSTPSDTRSLLYVYDMIPEATGFDLSHPEWREKRRAIEHADAYLALSESTAADLHAYYPVSLGRSYRLAYAASDPLFAPARAADVAAFAPRLGLPDDYCMFVGRRDVDYKNAALVLDALSLLPVAERPAMLFVGGAPELEPALAAEADGSVVRVAALSDEELRTAYSGARALLYPSKYEGFGIPILEAMACGCPVVTCALSSIPEVAGDAALYVSAEDPSQLAPALVSVRDAEVRERLRARGFERAASFRWKDTAAEAERLVRELAAATQRQEAAPGIRKLG